MIDLHTHILPGLDDGSQNWEQSLEMARMAVDNGITAMVCTPHWVAGKYENNRDTILARFAEFGTRLAEAAIPLVIYPGAELHLSADMTPRILSRELLTINDGGRYALIELPEGALPDNLEDFFWNMEMKGIKPIISHVERNPILRKDPMRLFRWVETGILTQVTAASLLNEFSEEIQEFSLMLVENRMTHMLVTDAHGLHIRIPKIREAYLIVEELVGPEEAHRLCVDTPSRILQGGNVPEVDPIQPSKKRSRPEANTRSRARKSSDGGFWRRLFKK